MAHPHKFTVYTIHKDLGNIVGYHSINYGFWSYINRWLSEYGTIDKPITDCTVQLVELTEPDELPKVGETFKFGKSEYIAVSKFTDNGEDFIVAKKQRTDGLCEYSHIFYIDKVLYELKKRS